MLHDNGALKWSGHPREKWFHIAESLTWQGILSPFIFPSPPPAESKSVPTHPPTEEEEKENERIFYLHLCIREWERERRIERMGVINCSTSFDGPFFLSILAGPSRCTGYDFISLFFCVCEENWAQSSGYCRGFRFFLSYYRAMCSDQIRTAASTVDFFCPERFLCSIS